jgi:glutamate dehydrogenase
VALIRTLSRFLRQVRVPYSQDYMWATLVKHATIAADIVELFHARFSPFISSFRSASAAGEPGIQNESQKMHLDSGSAPSARSGMTEEGAAQGRAAKQTEIAARIEDELQKVDSLDEDRILRRFVNAVQSAIRTNFFQTDKDGQLKPLIAVKFESGKITDLPLPRPLYEIFVYSPRVEGVHMRFGKVARGGIRWSDRPRGFPHRGAGTDEGPDGEERRHRAGGLEGRLRRQEAPGRRQPRPAPGRSDRVLQDHDARAARPDR